MTRGILDINGRANVFLEEDAKGNSVYLEVEDSNMWISYYPDHMNYYPLHQIRIGMKGAKKLLKSLDTLIPEIELFLKEIEDD